MTNYLSFTEALSDLVHSRIGALEKNRSLGLSCLALAETSKFEQSRYAYLLLAEQAINGDLAVVPTLGDFGYTPGPYWKLCSECGKQHQATNESTLCPICAEQKLARSVIGSADA